MQSENSPALRGKKGNNSSPSGQFFYSICSSWGAGWLQRGCSTPWCSPQLATTQTKGPVRAHRVLSLHAHQHMHVRCHMQVLFKRGIRTWATERAEIAPDKYFCTPLLRHSHGDQSTAQLFPRPE